MTIRESWVNFALRNVLILTAYPALLILPLISLAGCSGEGTEGPIGVSLSTPADATGGLDSDQSPRPDSADSTDEKDPVMTMVPTSTGVTAHLTWEHPANINVTSYSISYGKRSPDNSDSPALIAGEASPDETSLEDGSLEEGNVGDTSLEEPTSCTHGESVTVTAPSATITGLEPNTQYVFTIRAFNETDVEGICSNEFVGMTPATQS